MAAPTKIEFAVQMTCDGCAKAVRSALGGVQGITDVEIDVDKERVVVNTTLSTETVKDLIETTGMRAVLTGLGSTLATRNLGAAVAKISGDGTEAAPTIGLARFVQVDENTCVVDCTVDGLDQQSVTVNIHQLGDVSLGCYSCGDVYNGVAEGSDSKKPIGQLTTTKVDSKGRLEFRLTNADIKVWDIIGRSMVLHAANRRLACGIIARSAGIFENTKKLCACDGITIWDERDVPVAGGVRGQYAKQKVEPQATSNL